MIESNEKSINDCLDIVLSKLPEHKIDPLKELKDAEEEEAFESLVSKLQKFSDINEEGDSKLLISDNCNEKLLERITPLIGGYCRILYDFPFAYPEYDGKVSKEEYKAVVSRYETRIDRLNGLFGF